MSQPPIDINRTIRRGGHECAHCGHSPTDLAVVLLKCGGCGSVYYCNKEHQREDWKRHKELCKASAAQKAETAAVMGVKFSDYADNWRQQHIVAIVNIAFSLVTEANANTHALMLFCNYTTVGRKKLALIQVDRCEAIALTTLYAQYGGVEQGFAQLISNSKSVKGSTYYRVISKIKNNDQPDLAPLAKLSYLGRPRDVKTLASSYVMWMQAINKGDYSK